MNKKLIKLRVGNKAFERLTDSNEFIYPKSKIPKGYNLEVTKQVLILCPEKNELFELVEIDMNFTDKLCHVRINPFEVENSDIKSTEVVVNLYSENDSNSECYLHNRNAKRYLECCISAELNNGVCTRHNTYK